MSSMWVNMQGPLFGLQQCHGKSLWMVFMLRQVSEGSAPSGKKASCPEKKQHPNNVFHTSGDV